MAEAAWRTRIRQRVVSAHGSLRDADERLGLAEAFFNLPVRPQAATQGPEAWRHAWRVKLNLATDSLTEAARNLNHAVAYMEAADILALQGGTINASAPLPSIRDFYMQEATMQHALGRLQTSRKKAVGAYAFVRWCRGHLSMAMALVDDDNHGIPKATSLFHGENKAAFTALGEAIKRTEDALRDVNSALQFLAPGPSSIALQ